MLKELQHIQDNLFTFPGELWLLTTFDLQEDNDPKHTAKGIQICFNNKKVLCSEVAQSVREFVAGLEHG